MIKAQEMMKDIEDTINRKGSISMQKLITFITETNTLQDNIIQIVKTLSEHGFGPDDDDAQFDVITMLNSALSDLAELRKENDALQSQVRNSKIFEQELMES